MSFLTRHAQYTSCYPGGVFEFFAQRSAEGKAEDWSKARKCTGERSGSGEFFFPPIRPLSSFCHPDSVYSFYEFWDKE